ncbi:hypothetical protein BP5796_11664 [Coleophoma crateriformis]|uniref:Uncharacterized protein n=1 Tax=Coleophoma crateriformis TaxID=565419 RepID=A0A3D8QEI7_9HELO|nr:hypothetical protein BP5796_11664 [Coleophoma crateriformis]
MAPETTNPTSSTPRPKRATTQPKPARTEKPTIVIGDAAAEPPKKKQKLKYIPGGPGGGGRYVDPETGVEIPVGGTGPGGYNYIGPRGRVGRENLANGVVPKIYSSNRREKTSRTRPTIPRQQPPATRPTYASSSEAQAATMSHSDGYKPREERALEEIHPDLDINSTLLAIDADEVDGIAPYTRPVTPANGSINGRNGSPFEDEDDDGSAMSTPDLSMSVKIPGTPGGGKRKPGRPPKDPEAFYAKRALMMEHTRGPSQPTAFSPRTPRPAPILNFDPKEKLTLPQPSFRKSDTLARFEDKALGMERYVDQSMANVGYQITDVYVRPDTLIRASDHNLYDGTEFRVEYDMDEQDEYWLIAYNRDMRTAKGFEALTREHFEITLTKIELEMHDLEKRMPKPNPKPPQTHRPRSSSAAAVNGEPLPGEEQDSRCAVCDDGDCENTNAIVFCDGCDLAVHQECYGVPFIPEGQWLCRKCQLIGRGIPTCIFCPNKGGAFKQTNSSKWVHLLCAMWIREVSLGNHTFMEPVMDVERIPKTRWSLRCYLCKQSMGACVQCSSAQCATPFHITCARKAGLYMKMKNNHGTLAVLDGTTVMKAYCHKHCPSDYARENDVTGIVDEAQRYYKRIFKHQYWAENQEAANKLATRLHNARTEDQLDEPQLQGALVAHTTAETDKKGTQPPKQPWKLDSGTLVVPRIVFDVVESFLQRFNILKRREWTADLCKYWSLKREARRGAPLIKRLQLQNDSSMELTRRNYAGMGELGRQKLERRVEFSAQLVEDLKKLQEVSHATRDREFQKLKKAELEEEVMDQVYFPVAKMLPPILQLAKRLDEKKTVFSAGLDELQARCNVRYYVNASEFSRDFSSVFSAGLAAATTTNELARSKDDMSSPAKKAAADLKDRKRLAKRIIKAVTPLLQSAVEAEAALNEEPKAKLLEELDQVLEAALEIPAKTATEETEFKADDGDTVIVDSPSKLSPSKRIGTRRTNGIPPEDVSVFVEDDVMDVDAPCEVDDEAIVPVASEPGISEAAQDVSVDAQSKNSAKTTSTPPDSNGYVSAPEPQQTSPPTPPISTGGVATDVNNALGNGGVPWVYKDLNPDGTNIPEENLDTADAASDELSEMDDDELNGLGADVDSRGEASKTAATPSHKVTKTKKGRTKKRWRGFK